jgi:serine/threonine-protein kinase
MSQAQSGEDRVSGEVLAMLADRYDVQERIGEGGVGLVYRGVLRELNLPVAIKVLRPEFAANREVLARFQREAATASSIGNPHIVRMVELSILPNGAAYLAMEYLEGQSLAVHMKRGALSVDEAISIGVQIMEALGACHERDVVHRDLKPDNIVLVEREGRPSFVKIVDFGMVRLVGSSSKLTNQGAIIGTPHYMAPEQCQGKTADHRADIYSVGILLYRMIAGRVPFDGDKWLEVLSQQVHAEPVPPSKHLPAGALPRALEAVILKAMHKDPAQRFQSMREMMQAVGDAMTESVLHSMEPPLPDAGAAATGAAGPNRGLWLGAVLGLGALLLAGGAALYLLRQ